MIPKKDLIDWEKDAEEWADLNVKYNAPLHTAGMRQLILLEENKSLREVNKRLTAKNEGLKEGKERLWTEVKRLNKENEALKVTVEMYNQGF